MAPSFLTDHLSLLLLQSWAKVQPANYKKRIPEGHPSSALLFHLLWQAQPKQFESKGGEKKELGVGGGGWGEGEGKEGWGRDGG